MRGERAFGAGMFVAVAVGAAATTQGTLTGETKTFRAGIAILVLSCTALIWCGTRQAARRIMEQQRRLMALTEAERQEYAEMGWRAAVMDMGATGSASRDSNVVQMPRTSPRRGA